MSRPESRPDRPAVTDLERRYARWTALFYPADYRRERGSELVDTYLSLAEPGRRRPSPADIADLAAGGLRRHLRTAPGVTAGFRLAGLLALTTAAAFASAWAVLEVMAPMKFWSRYTGPFMSLGMAAWAVWLLAAVVHLVAPGRWYRRAAVIAVLVTAAVVPAGMLTGLFRPPLIVLVPQLVLGIVALGADAGRRWWVRLAPLAAAASTVPVTVVTEARLDFYGDYYLPAVEALPAVGVTLLIGATLLALGFAARHDLRGAWALLFLLTPIGMLTLNPLGAMLDSGPGRPQVPVWSSMAAAAMLVAVVGPVLLTLALAAQGRRSTGGRPLPTHCPTCGAPSNSA